MIAATIVLFCIFHPIATTTKFRFFLGELWNTSYNITRIWSHSGNTNFIRIQTRFATIERRQIQALYQSQLNWYRMNSRRPIGSTASDWPCWSPWRSEPSFRIRFRPKEPEAPLNRRRCNSEYRPIPIHLKKPDSYRRSDLLRSQKLTEYL